MFHHRFRCIVAGLLVTILAQHVVAQDSTRQRRLQFVEGLLKLFIDSQLPGQITPATTTRPPVSVSGSGSSQLQEAGQVLSQVSDEMTQLVDALQGDI